jgi:hypothetical protein
MMIHRFWTGPPRAEHHWIDKVVRRAHPHIQVKDWTLDEIPMLLDPDTNPVHLSNVVRYWALHEHGGLWLDHDIIPLRSLTGAPRAWTAAMGNLREGSVMWFPQPGHPMLAELLEVSQSRPALPGAPDLREVGQRYPTVGYEQRVLPLNAIGQRTAITEVWAVHLWSTTSVTGVQNQVK